MYALLLAAVLIFIGWRFRIRPPALFALYVAMYTFGRFFEELLRVDPAHEIGPLRLNAWVSILALHRLDGVLRLVAVLPPRTPRRKERPRVPPKSPTMAIPKRRRVRPSR